MDQNMCREILNTCTRNTEEAEKAPQAAAAQASGKGSGKGIWVLIKDSELARSIQQDEAKVPSSFIAISVSVHANLSAETGRRGCYR